jgi:hypothetical protein
MRTKLLCFLVLAVLLAACSDGDEGNGDDGNLPEVVDRPTLCPLTGVEAAEGVEIDRPALAVKIDNAPPARPQAGLDAADVVYEELSEGGLTRFLTIFHCNDAELVGPVRSARTVDPEILKEYDPALFAHSGANPQVLDKIADSDWVVDLKHGDHGDAYTRASDRRAPYNLMTTTNAIRELEGADAGGPPETGFTFNADVLNPPAEASPAEGASPAAAAEAPAPGNSVTLSFSNANVVKYNYDPGTKTYLRSHGDVTHQLANGTQVSAVNVVVQKIKTVPGTVRDASGALTVDTTVVGSGDVTVLRGGVAVTGKWNRATLDDKTTFTDVSGETIEFAPGNTFIHLVPQDRPVTVQ